ncbi:MAG: hypothetical protein NTY86_16690 [Deltaproteobacteria bacterium]|nr:hypothetical protein [Deltaproteobacteria bacterium]
MTVERTIRAFLALDPQEEILREIERGFRTGCGNSSTGMSAGSGRSRSI